MVVSNTPTKYVDVIGLNGLNVSLSSIDVRMLKNECELFNAQAVEALLTVFEQK